MKMIKTTTQEEIINSIQLANETQISSANLHLSYKNYLL